MKAVNSTTQPQAALPLEQDLARLIVSALSLEVAPEAIAPEEPLFGDGLGLAEPLPATLVFDHPTIGAISTYLGGLLADGSAAAAPALAEPAQVTDIAGLTDAEVEDLLVRKLEGRS